MIYPVDQVTGSQVLFILLPKYFPNLFSGIYLYSASFKPYCILCELYNSLQTDLKRSYLSL